MSNILTGADFEGKLDGFGAHSAEQLDELNKALGTGTDGDAYGDHADGSALRPESLEGTLKVVIATDKHIKFWKDLYKKPAYNTVEEYNVLDSYGGDVSPFFTEGGLPTEEDSNYERKTALVKFLGTTRVITHPMTLVRSAHGDVIARETRNGTLWLMQQQERKLFYANSSLDSLEYDGIEKQIIDKVGLDGEQIIDMKGAPLNEAVLEDGANVIMENFGSASKLYLTPKAHVDLSKIMYPRQRTGMPAPIDGKAGVPLTAFQSNGGTFTFEPDIFIRPRGGVPTEAKADAPTAPVWTSTTELTAGASATGKGLPAGTYSYQVTAVNAIGESVAEEAETVVVTANQQVTLSWAKITVGAVKSYRIYRDNGDGKILFMTEIAQPTTATPVTFIDRNENIPGTSKAFLCDLDSDQSMAYKQLAPLMKLPLARISAAERFMVLLYGMPIVYNPRRNVIIKNIGNYVEE